MKLFSWINGRQGSGYKTTYFIYSSWLKLECCIISVNNGVSIPPHRDECPDNGEVYRFNFELKRPKVGGRFVGKTLWSIGNRLYFFRPDKELHEVTKVESGNLLIFSICKVMQ